LLPVRRPRQAIDTTSFLPDVPPIPKNRHVALTGGECQHND
jgi:hypothetical protein